MTKRKSKSSLKVVQQNSSTTTSEPIQNKSSSYNNNNNNTNKDENGNGINLDNNQNLPDPETDNYDNLFNTNGLLTNESHKNRIETQSNLSNNNEKLPLLFKKKTNYNSMEDGKDCITSTNTTMINNNISNNKSGDDYFTNISKEAKVHINKNKVKDIVQKENNNFDENKNEVVFCSDSEDNSRPGGKEEVEEDEEDDGFKIPKITKVVSLAEGFKNIILNDEKEDLNANGSQIISSQDSLQTQQQQQYPIPKIGTDTFNKNSKYDLDLIIEEAEGDKPEEILGLEFDDNDYQKIDTQSLFSFKNENSNNTRSRSLVSSPDYGAFSTTDKSTSSISSISSNFYNDNYNYNGHYISNNNSSNSSILKCNSIANPVLPDGNVVNANNQDLIHYCEHTSCGKLTNKTCSSCKNAHYCCLEHLRLDWKRHKEKCLAYKLKTIPGNNDETITIAVAQRNLPAGQAIFREKPNLVFPIADPDNEFDHIMESPCIVKFEENNKNAYYFDQYCYAKKPACLGCGQAVEFIGPVRYSCTSCSLPLCSENCQYYFVHKYGECDAIVNTRSVDLVNENFCIHRQYLDIEILRALQLAVTNPDDWERFLSLSYNVRVESYRNSYYYRNFERKANILVPISAKLTGYNYKLILTVHSIITALSIRPYLNSPFKALFITQQFFAHDCIPNTISYFENDKYPERMQLIVKASVTILKDIQITVDILPTPYLSYPNRRRLLKNASIDNCTCYRCISPSKIGDRISEVKCPYCHSGLVYPEEPIAWENSVWSCFSCEEECPFSHVQEIEANARFVLSDIPKSIDGLEQLKEFVFTMGGKFELNRNHQLVIMAWCFIERILDEKHRQTVIMTLRNPNISLLYSEDLLKDFSLLEQYCEIVESHLNAIRQGLFLDRGILYYTKFFSHYILATRNYQEEKCTRKDFIQKIFKSLKILKESLQILTVFEGQSSIIVSHIIQEGTSALITLKDYASKLLKEEQRASERKPIQ